jgi:hypothetical protein
VASTIVPSYLAPEAEAQIKWVDRKKPLFTFRIKLLSTLYTQDENLNEFFTQFHTEASKSKQFTMVKKKYLIFSQLQKNCFYIYIF